MKDLVTGLKRLLDDDKRALSTVALIRLVAKRFCSVGRLEYNHRQAVVVNAISVNVNVFVIVLSKRVVDANYVRRQRPVSYWLCFDRQKG